MTVIRTLLVGGPSDFPAAQRMQTISSPGGVITCPFRAGYEHFSRTGTSATLIGEEFAVFDWTARTATAG